MFNSIVATARIVNSKSSASDKMLKVMEEVGEFAEEVAISSASLIRMLE